MIYFCIPTYNEERTVGVVLWKLRQVMAELQRDYQIIVVDDASTDSTPAVLSPYIRVLPLTVIRNSERRGYADSLEIALREAARRSPYPKRDAVIVLQADFTEDPDVLGSMIKRFEAGADVVACDVVIEEAIPRPVRWGRRYLRWALRGKEWSALGDPLSGLRAYRVIVLKKAIEARGTNRLLSYQGAGANVELLQQVLPHSRRNDVAESTLLHHRLQRPLRFSFMQAWREVRGAARGRIAPNARALPTDSVVATPLPVAVEAPMQRHERGGRNERDARQQRGGRGERPARTGRGARSEQPRGARPDRPARTERTERPERPRREEQRPRRQRPEKPAAVAEDAIAAQPPSTAEGEARVEKKRRRRPRRRKEKKTQDGSATPQLVIEQTSDEPVASDAEMISSDGDAAPKKKKSRRGRRGGRGRRRGPRVAGEANAGDDSSDASEMNDGGPEDVPPAAAAEGD